MNILALNCGSSSVKYQLYDADKNKLLAKGAIERIGFVGTFIIHQTKNQKHRLECECATHKDAIYTVFKFLTDEEFGVITELNQIDAVGHRIVHGGEKFDKSVLVDDKVISEIDSLSTLAPLHNPPNLAGIMAIKSLCPNVPQVAVFDTAFHQTMPATAYLYAIPMKWYEKYGVRKYGFHGTSHLYVTRRAACMLNKDIKDTKFISLHIGNGVSVTAVKGGKSIDTSMGFTPLDGAVMGTRSGSIDPAVVLFMMDKEGFTTEEVNTVLNKRSGVLGITGRYTDRRDISRVAGEGDKLCQLAMDIESYRLKKLIGEYYAVLGGLDAVIFTAGVGENSSIARKMVCDGLEHFGIFLDDEKNENAHSESDISKDESPVKVLMIPTNEEIVIIEDVKAILDGTYHNHDFKYSFEVKNES
ncbi:MAG TPA: acetate kinase [Candidatus Mucispirillum faecigallinarum]|uniref:Acetate kinase n=1 Tax=Candidatus Mucispirillum faecigallinarum TaxID=2838699 RepID=A0A9D2GTK7_9BACT|nr:acetate kinase [Candidatus Mucispirillum faecigallinarum]